jgi:tetratricopeptide (TPR) repeat protein
MVPEHTPEKGERMPRSKQLVLAAFVALVVIAGCARKEHPSALYVLQELETASAVKNPEERIERLNIFVRNHANSPYRILAYRRVFDAMMGDLKDEAGASRYLAEALAKETDESVRGDLLYAKFSHLYESNKGAALTLADSLLSVESAPRLFLYMGYDLMDCKERPELAERCFLKSADLTPLPILRSQAVAMAGVYLESIGKKDEARKYLAAAAGNPEADMTMGKLLWEEGEKDRALDTYIRCAARMPGAREWVKLDSLYAIVHASAGNLDERIASLRIVDEGPLPEARFVDINGESHDLSMLKGTKIVINALSPT